MGILSSERNWELLGQAYPKDKFYLLGPVWWGPGTWPASAVAPSHGGLSWMESWKPLGTEGKTEREKGWFCIINTENRLWMINMMWLDVYCWLGVTMLPGVSSFLCVLQLKLSRKHRKGKDDRMHQRSSPRFKQRTFCYMSFILNDYKVYKIYLKFGKTKK